MNRRASRPQQASLDGNGDRGLQFAGVQFMLSQSFLNVRKHHPTWLASRSVPGQLDREVINKGDKPLELGAGHGHYGGTDRLLHP